MSAAADSTGYACTPPGPLEEIDADLKRVEEEIVRLREVVG